MMMAATNSRHPDAQADAQTGTQADAAARVCVGVVTGAHGLKGLVRVKPFTETPEGVAAYGPVESEDGERRYELAVANRTGKGQVLVRIDGVATREAADALKGERFYVGRDRLPPPDEDEYYHADLIGLRADLPDGTVLGTVRAIYAFGAGDVVEIADPDGKLLTAPFTRAAVPEVDLAGGRIVVASEYLITPDAPGGGRDDGGENG